MIPSLEPRIALVALLEALESAGLGCTMVIDRPEGPVERVFANRAFAEILGLDVEAARKVPVLDVVTPRERERLAALRSSLSADRPGPHLLETEVLRADGKVIQIEVALGYARLDVGVAAFTFIRDLSGKAAMARALRESEERFRHIAEASPDSVAVYVNGKYTYANPVAMRVMGVVTADELARVDPRSLVPPDRRDVVNDAIARLKAGETIAPIELRHTLADGREVVLEASLRLAAIHGETAILSYTRDITERNRLHAELMKQDRLASVGMLAAGVAHELNNPLTALAMQVRQLREDAHEWPPHVDHVLRQMEEATNGMNAIISDLLFMARPVEKPQAHVDVAKIIQSTVALLRAGTPRCPPVKVDIDALPALHGWASKLGQVFLNVLRNAVQAVESVPNGTVQVRGRIVGDGIEVTVSDNGPGVTPQVLARLAQPFFTTKPQGTGLGLWISQTLVAQHGGKLDVASTEGGGTTVTVSLPQTLAGAPP